MEHILAKVSKKLYKLISDNKLYDDIVFNASLYVEYSSDHNLDEECWFFIDEFSQKKYFPSQLKNGFDSKEFDNINKSDFSRIKYVVSVQQEENVFCFQKITPSLFLHKKYISLNEHAKIEENSSILIVHSEPDAVYFKDKDIFIFKKLPLISSMFNGIDTLYKEATDEEVQAFLLNDFIAVGSEFTKEKVSKPNRKRIAMAIDTLGSFDDDKKKMIISYINEYCSDKLVFNKENNSFEVSNDEQLKVLLYGIEQRFYTTKIGNEKRLANSIVRIG